MGITYSGTYTLASFNPATGEYTLGAYDSTPWEYGDDETDTDFSDGTSGDGVELSNEALASGQVGTLNASVETYTGWTIGGSMVITDGSSYYVSATQGALEPSGTATSTPSFAYCFLPGTLITTPDGDRQIETLAIGDMVTLASGAQKPIKWVGRMTTELHRFNRSSASPILVRAGAFGGGLPKRDLYTSYRHGFELEGVLVIAGLLVNGTSIVQCTDWPEEQVTYYQIEVEGHELMLAEGAAAETLSEASDSRELFDNAAEYHALYPDAQPIEPMQLGRVIVKRQLPRSVKERIAAAAAELDSKSRVA